MYRSCLLCIGNKMSLDRLIVTRKDSNKRDYMKYLFSIPIKDYVCISAIRASSTVKNILPKNDFLRPGYCGEECRNLLIRNGFIDKYVICGIEMPGCGYTTYDIVFPQGRCEKGEDTKTAAFREFSEETGIDLYRITSTIDDNRMKFLGFVGKRREMSVYAYIID